MTKQYGSVTYDSLDTQIRVHLMRRGPMAISKLIAQLRHNANGKAVHEALHRLASTNPPQVVKFDYSWDNGRRVCTHGVVRLPEHKASDYDPFRDPRQAPKGVLKRRARKARTQPPAKVVKPVADGDFEFLG